MKEHVREEPMILAAAERRMQAWSMSGEIADRNLRADLGETSENRVREFVAISREAGAGGSQVAQMVGRALGWKVLDKNLLDDMAEHCRASRTAIVAVDETATNWAYDTLGAWLDSGVVSQEKYVARLRRLLGRAARRESLVCVGRGAQFLLPRQRGLAVRIVAPVEYRVERLSRRENIPPAKARRLMTEIDLGRRQFVRHFFHHDVGDPHLYDLVVNVGHISLEAAARHIVQAYRDREEAS